MNDKLLGVALLFVLGATPRAYADDIDIYMNTSVPVGSEPMVMFSIEGSSSMGATHCNIGACSADVVQLYNDGFLLENPNTEKISRFQLLRGVLKKFFKTLSGVRVGLMFSHADSCSGNPASGPTKTGCSNGGYIAAGFRLLTVTKDSSGTVTDYDPNGNKASLAAILNGIPNSGGTVNHPFQGKETFFEFFRYLTGKPIYNGHLGYKDYGNNTAGTNLDVDWPAIDWDAAIESGANYMSPITSTCAKIYTVNFLWDQAPSGTDSQSDSAITSSVDGMPGINLNGTSNKFDTVIRWLYDNDINANPSDGKQNVISYFVTEKNNTSTRSWAGAGVGVSATTPYSLSQEPTALIATLTSIFRNILSTSTTFVAPAVAVNVYNRAQVRNEVYIAMFQANEGGYPNWPGNLKKYAIGDNAAGDLQIEDATGEFAIATDGRVDYDALSYWTFADNLPTPSATSTDVAGKDGRAVKRGGAGSKVPGFRLDCSTDHVNCPGSYTPGLTNPAGNTTDITTRKLFTEPNTFTNGSSTALMAFNADTTSASALQSALRATSVGDCTGADPDTAACRLIAFARGVEFTATGTKARSWIMGDLLHSRPIAVNYGARGAYTTSNPDIRLIAGSNDGFMHMFRNTKSSQTDATVANDTDGVEAWAFIPREVMPTLNTLIKQSTVATPPHPYTVDGAPAVYIYDADADGNIEPTDHVDANGATQSGDRVYLYFGLRRGGTSYYALNITDPDEPKLLWRIGKGAAGSAFAELGQSWSTPKVGKMVFGGATTPAPVLVFGGGYDPNKDTHPGHGGYTATAIGTDDTQGNAIFIVHAVTGELIWKAVKGTTTGYDAAAKAYRRTDMRDSIPSDVIAIDTDGNKLVDRIYVGDTGGVVWRADTRSNNQANWTLKPILSVGRHADSTGSLANDRRFFYPPDYVQTKDSDGAYDAIIIGTGDRENPLDTAVTNWFYMFKDRNITTGTFGAYAYPESGDNLGDVTDYAYAATLDVSKGWRLQLECPPAFPSTCGEKNLSPAFTLSGKVYFTTYKPPSSVTGAGCSLAEGGGMLYAVSLQLGKSVDDLDVTNNTAASKLFESDRYKELASGGIPAEVVSIGGGRVLQPDLYIRDTGTEAGMRTYWYEKATQ